MKLSNWVFTVMLSLLAVDTMAELLVENGYVRMPPPGTSVAAAYFDIRNVGSAAVKVSSIATDLARHAMFHRVVVRGGATQMRHVDAIVVPPGETVSLAPGQLHVMMMGISGLTVGQQIEFDLVLSSGESLKVWLPVRVE